MGDPLLTPESTKTAATDTGPLDFAISSGECQCRMYGRCDDMAQQNQDETFKIRFKPRVSKHVTWGKSNIRSEILSNQSNEGTWQFWY